MSNNAILSVENYIIIIISRDDHNLINDKTFIWYHLCCRVDPRKYCSWKQLPSTSNFDHKFRTMCRDKCMICSQKWVINIIPGLSAIFYWKFIHINIPIINYCKSNLFLGKNLNDFEISWPVSRTFLLHIPWRNFFLNCSIFFLGQTPNL